MSGKTSIVNIFYLLGVLMLISSEGMANESETWCQASAKEAFAYSSLAAGRVGTSGEGMVHLLFEGGPAHGLYSDMQVARFNLRWILEGEKTGNGDLPVWVQ